MRVVTSPHFQRSSTWIDVKADAGEDGGVGQTSLNRSECLLTHCPYRPQHLLTESLRIQYPYHPEFLLLASLMIALQ